MKEKDVIDHLIEIKEAVASQAGKINEICRNTKAINKRIDKVEDRIEKLPCDNHMNIVSDKLDKKVPWKVFTWVLTMVISMILGAYTYTNFVDNDLHKHETAVLPHYYSVPSSGSDICED